MITMMSTDKPYMVTNTSEIQPQHDLDNRIRDLTNQLAEARAEAAHYERSRSQQELEQKQPPVYQEQPINNNGSQIASYSSQAPVPSSNRAIAPLSAPNPSIPEAPPPPYAMNNDQIPLPIVLPQTSKNFRGAFYSPFVRAYVPELEAHGFSQSDFLTFIDGLNEAFVANPVFEGFGIAGMIMQQFYGIQPVQWAGMGLQVASGVASAATSYARTRAYVKAVNADLFHPSGLHVNILTTKKMMAKVGHPEERLSLPPLETTDQLDSSVLSREASSSSTEILNEDARMRRIRALKGYVMPLDFDVPEAVTPDNVLKRMGNAQAKRQAKKQQKKDDKRREKALEKRDDKLDKADEKIEEIDKDLAKERRKMEKDLSKSKAQKDPKEKRKIEKDFAKEERKLKEDLEKALKKKEKKMEKHGQREGEGAGSFAKVDKREEKTANKIRWVVITVWNGEGSEDGEEEEDDDTRLESSESSGRR